MCYDYTIKVRNLCWNKPPDFRSNSEIKHPNFREQAILLVLIDLAEANMYITDYDFQIISAIVDRIDRLRTECGFSVYQLALKASIPENTLKHIYKKKNYPNFYTIQRLCEAFEITPSEFFLYDTGSVKFSKAEIELLHDFEKLSPRSRQLICDLVKHMK